MQVETTAPGGFWWICILLFIIFIPLLCCFCFFPWGGR